MFPMPLRQPANEATVYIPDVLQSSRREREKQKIAFVIRHKALIARICTYTQKTRGRSTSAQRRNVGLKSGGPSSNRGSKHQRRRGSGKW